MRESPRISKRTHKFEGEESFQRPCDINVQKHAKNKKQREYRRGKARFITSSPQAVASRAEVLHQSQYGASAEAFRFPPGKKKPDAGFYNDIHSKTLLSSSLFYIADSPHGGKGLFAKMDIPLKVPSQSWNKKKKKTEMPVYIGVQGDWSYEWDENSEHQFGVAGGKMINGQKSFIFTAAQNGQPHGGYINSTWRTEKGKNAVFAVNPQTST